MNTFEAAQAAQQAFAAERFARGADERRKKIKALKQPGGIGAVNSPTQLARRADRLTRYLAGEDVPVTAAQMPAARPAEVLAAAFERAPTGVAEVLPAAADDKAVGTNLEKIINTADFVGIRYLEAGVAAARAVCRVDIRDEAGRVIGYGTGSLVSPRLLLTNHHVFPALDVARAGAVEFNYQDGVDGQPLQPRLFRLDPDTFFLNDKERDFALVAVQAGEAALTEFGFNRLIEATGKAVIGEFVTIVQHPRGERKQVALRENKVVELLDNFMHYEADTEPGSSGSPVFNDQWEVVALHHASVPAPDKQEYGGFMNEGIRVSRILEFVRSKSLPAESGALAAQLFTPEQIVINTQAAIKNGTSPSPKPEMATASVSPLPARADGSVRIIVPLEISVRLGSAGGSDLAGPPAETADADLSVDTEAITIDPDYSNRKGYAADFLGGDVPQVPLPALSPELQAKSSINADAKGANRNVLPYHHFSVVVNKERKLALFTAVNIDGRLSKRLKREPDRWYFDKRVPETEQTGEAVYQNNPLDRGHLVRRLDPAWGTSRAAAKRANDDTFHFTNCTPQHKDFNELQTYWAGLEEYILLNAMNRDLKVCVFSGPVFAEDDDEYRGVQLPRQFWKVVVMAKTNGELSATGYVLSQAALIQGLEVAEEFSYGAYRTYQVPVQRIESLTDLSFNGLAAVDPLASIEAVVPFREVRSDEDIVL